MSGGESNRSRSHRDIFVYYLDARVGFVPSHEYVGVLASLIIESWKLEVNNRYILGPSSPKVAYGS
jgi:hypothetical protein